jgi:hypothetical protein
MRGHRFATTIGRAALTGAMAAVVCAALLGFDSASARPRPPEWLLQQPEQAEQQSFPAQRDELFPSQRNGRGVSLAQATAMAQSRFQGRVVRAETVRVGDRLVHEIRILGEDGRTVRSFRIDAQTGQFL